MNLTTEVCMGELTELGSLPECWISVAEERKWDEFWKVQSNAREVRLQLLPLRCAPRVDCSKALTHSENRHRLCGKRASISAKRCADAILRVIAIAHQACEWRVEHELTEETQRECLCANGVVEVVARRYIFIRKKQRECVGWSRGLTVDATESSTGLRSSARAEIESTELICGCSHWCVDELACGDECGEVSQILCVRGLCLQRLSKREPRKISHAHIFILRPCLREQFIAERALRLQQRACDERKRVSVSFLGGSFAESFHKRCTRSGMFWSR